MKNLFELPDWISGMIAGILGFLAKAIYDNTINKKNNRISARSKLKEFENILKVGKSVFHDQTVLRNRLYNSLSDNNEYFNNGYNEGFSKLYDTMNENQMETFQLIRGITENSIYILNDSLTQWMNKNETYSLTTKKSPIVDQFDKDIHSLKEHLLLWFSKFNSVFKNNPKYCLVYLGDEKSDGVKFPPTIEDSVAKMINFLSK